MNRNLANIIAIELLISTQGVEFRAPIETSTQLRRVMSCIRAEVPPLGDDRYLADDIATVRQLVFDGRIIEALADDSLLPELSA